MIPPGHGEGRSHPIGPTSTRPHTDQRTKPSVAVATASHWLLDAWREATSHYWLQRADEIEDAGRPRPGDFLGASTAGQRAARRDRCAATAAAMRARATLAYVSDAEFKAALIDVAGDPYGIHEAEAHCAAAIARGDLTAINHWMHVLDAADNYTQTGQRAA